MHSFQEATSGPPSLLGCFEKESLAGVYFHNERLVSELGIARAASHLPQAQQQPHKKKARKAGGTGVYFENSEVKTVEGCMHPLQTSRHRSDSTSSPHHHSSRSSSMTPPMSCPVGQPLFAPPVLATTIQYLDDEAQEELMRQMVADPSMMMKTSTISSGFSKKCDNQRTAKVISREGGGQGCAQSCEGGGEGDGSHLFCETNRTAMLQRLHSRDYRLSTDELVFVEAAVKLSKGCSPPPAPTHYATRSLSKPSLPHHHFMGGYR